LTPYTGASCGWGISLDLQAYLYSVTIANYNMSDGCENLVQDVAETNLGQGYFTTGTIKEFTPECWVHGAGDYSFSITPGCDAAGTGAVTGNADFTMDFP